MTLPIRPTGAKRPDPTNSPQVKRQARCDGPSRTSFIAERYIRTIEYRDVDFGVDHALVGAHGLH